MSLVLGLLCLIGFGYIAYRALKPNFTREAQLGVTRGKERAQLGIWSWWKEPDGQKPILKLTMEFEGNWDQGKPAIEYAFIPVNEQPFVQSIELTPEFRELIVGSKRATEGAIKFVATLIDNTVKQFKIPLDEFIQLYRGGGRKPEFPVTELLEPLLPAPAEFRGLGPDALVEKGKEIIRKREEERKAAEEKARKEAEEAAEKAAAAARAAAEKEGKSSGAAADKLMGAADIEQTKIGLVYGSSTGNTADVADQIKGAFGEDSFLVKDVTTIGEDIFKKFDYVVLGVPTWHIGEMQDDWAAFLPKLEQKKLDLKGKKLAIFGLGDGAGYPDTYVDAMKELWDIFKPSGIELVGYWPTEGYIFEKSTAIENGKFLGLVIDIENQNDQTDARVKGWVKQVKGEFGI